MAKEDVPKLTPGSRYRVLSMMTRSEPLVTEGVFKGYTVVGTMEALCLEVAQEGDQKAKGSKGSKGSKKKKKKSMRLIPSQMIISIDILSQAKAEKEEDASPSDRYYM